MILRKVLVELRSFLREHFDLIQEKENEIETMEAIRKGVVFKGSSLWVLIFAIFIASLGLNINSTAVIIGAMLISPLMGPIMGIGLGVGINDWELIKKAFKNLAIATLFSIATATLFFALSPINDARSELLARTTPSTYDVLIAFFGGMAGIVAGSVKGRGGNVIPGVAIATALMPPLCTAGFGIATGNLNYFIGAFYLYFINSVFISLATYIGVRIMKFPAKQFVDPAREKRVRQTILTVTILTLIPSIWMSYGLVKENILEKRVSTFVSEELAFPSSEIFKKEITDTKEGKAVIITLIGQEVSADLIDNALSKRKNYGLDNVSVTIRQGLGSKQIDVNYLRSELLQDFYASSQQQVKTQQLLIDSLTYKLKREEEQKEGASALAKEVKVLFPHITHISLGQTHSVDLDSQTEKEEYTVIVNGEKRAIEKERNKLEEWIKVRLSNQTVKLITR